MPYTNALPAKSGAQSSKDKHKPFHTRLALVDEDYTDIMKEFFPPTSSDFVDFLVSEYNADKVRIEGLSAHMESNEATSALHFFIEGNLWDERHGMPRKIKSLFNIEGALGHLDASYWQKAFALTDVYDYMPQARRNDWDNQIRFPLGRKAAGGEKEIQPLPAFTESTVRATIQELLNSRSLFFGERVDGIFYALSRTHVTNQPEGFSKRMILNGVIDKYGSVDYSTAGVLNDLRCVIARFMGRDEPKHGDTAKMIGAVRKKNGVWASIDGGSLRMRIYNGVGTAHIEIHPEMSWRLNAILNYLHPQAIPAKHRKRPAKAKTAKIFELFDKPLPFAVLNFLGRLEKDFDLIGEGYRATRKYIPNSLRDLFSWDTADKAVKSQAEDVLKAIGGVKSKNGWRFSYDPTEVIDEILCTGSIPDRQSHQYYSTPKALAEMVADRASVGAIPGMSWLEPHAGTGGLADYVPEDANLLCCEISPLHCKILESKYNGFDGMPRKVECLDFLDFSKSYVGKGFDRILMNPPYSQKRWQTHLEAAASVLAKSGRLVAILPSSAAGKELIPGYSHTYSAILSNMFEGTSISVVILTLEPR